MKRSTQYARGWLRPQYSAAVIIVFSMGVIAFKDLKLAEWQLLLGYIGLWLLVDVLQRAANRRAERHPQ